MTSPAPPSKSNSDTRAMRIPINIGIEYTAKAVVGIASPSVGFITLLQEQVEWHLRVASLLVGSAVGILSFVAMARKMRRR
jgi:dipeptide/tripeptide permease